MSIVTFSPQSKSFVSRNSNGTFDGQLATKQGIVKNNPPTPAGPKVLSQHPTTASPAVKILR